MGAGIFLAMWVTMMAAMMLPTVAPIVLAHLADHAQTAVAARADTLVLVARLPRRVVGDRSGAARRLPGTSRISARTRRSRRWLPALAGAILVVAGAYQFTGWKQVCFDHCQSPFAFIAMHDFGGGVPARFAPGSFTARTA